MSTSEARPNADLDPTEGTPLRRVADFLDAWLRRTGNDREVIYDLDGGLDVKGGTTLRHSDLRALVHQILLDRDRLASAEAKVRRVEELANWWDTELADDETTYGSASDDLVAALSNEEADRG